MKLSELIRELNAQLTRHGDIECFIQIPGDEQDIDHVGEAFHLHGDPAKPKFVAISTDPNGD